MNMTRRGVLWAAGALLGIAVTAALTWSVSRLSGQRIGLSSQPLSVIRALAPPPTDDRAASPLTNRAQSPEAPALTGPSTASTTPRLALPGTRGRATARGTQAQTGPGAGASSAGSGGDHADDAGQSGQGGSSPGPASSGAAGSGAAGSGRDD